MVEGAIEVRPLTVAVRVILGEILVSHVCHDVSLERSRVGRGAAYLPGPYVLRTDNDNGNGSHNGQSWGWEWERGGRTAGASRTDDVQTS